jgi:hypothetical protein
MASSFGIVDAANDDVLGGRGVLRRGMLRRGVLCWEERRVGGVTYE